MLQKQIFLPPHRRLEERADQQNDMERAFEDMYLADTDLQGDLTLALDPHPPPSTTEAGDADLELSVLDPSVAPSKETDAAKKTILSDVTNVDRSQIINKDKTPG